MLNSSTNRYTRHRSLAHASRQAAIQADPTNHRRRIQRELKQLGVSKAALASKEGKYLPLVIHPDEQIGGIVYGFHEDGFAMLVATDRRVIFLDRKPLFSNEDEVNYYVVSGVKYGHVGLLSTVTLHTRIRDYSIKTFNHKCAKGFVEYIETRSLEHGDQR